MNKNIRNFIKYTNYQAQTISNYTNYLKNESHNMMISEFINILSLSKPNNQNIYVTGIGKNDPIAEKTANMLRSIGINAHKLDCVHAMHGDMGMIKDGDIIICLSKSGNTSELIHFLKYIKSIKNVIITGVTSNENSEFDKLCNQVFSLPVTELDVWNKIPTNSNIIYQMFLDSIIMSAFEDEITLEGFVKTHPGGDIGQTFV